MPRRPPKRKLTLEPDPLGFLERMFESEVPRRVEEEGIKHYTYGRMDQSARSGDTRIRRCYDNSWRCFDSCRPVNEAKAAERILEAFACSPMFLDVVPNCEKKTVPRVVEVLGGNYVSVPIGSHVAVISDVPLGDNSYPVPDKSHLVRSIVMKVRWIGANISGSRGFLPPARKLKKFDRWEAYHPSTGRRCGHMHAQPDDAVTCASEIGGELDGSSEGWYIRCTTEWKALGTVRMTTHDKLAISVEQCGLRVAVNLPDEYDPNGSLVILAVEWDDERYVRWREENHYAMPATASGWWRPPALESDWAVDHLGRITGS